MGMATASGAGGFGATGVASDGFEADGAIEDAVISRLKAPHISRFVYSSSLKHPEHKSNYQHSQLFSPGICAVPVFFLYLPTSNRSAK